MSYPRACSERCGVRLAATPKHRVQPPPPAAIFTVGAFLRTQSEPFEHSCVAHAASALGVEGWGQGVGWRVEGRCEVRVEKSQGSQGGPGTQEQLGFAWGEAPSVGVKHGLLCFISASPLPTSLLWGFRSARSDRTQVRKLGTRGVLCT